MTTPPPADAPPGRDQGEPMLARVLVARAADNASLPLDAAQSILKEFHPEAVTAVEPLEQLQSLLQSLLRGAMDGSAAALDRRAHWIRAERLLRRINAALPDIDAASNSVDAVAPATTPVPVPSPTTTTAAPPASVSPAAAEAGPAAATSPTLIEAAQSPESNPLDAMDTSPNEIDEPENDHGRVGNARSFPSNGLNRTVAVTTEEGSAPDPFGSSETSASGALAAFSDNFLSQYAGLLDFSALGDANTDPTSRSSGETDTSPKILALHTSLDEMRRTAGGDTDQCMTDKDASGPPTTALPSTTKPIARPLSQHASLPGLEAFHGQTSVAEDATTPTNHLTGAAASLFARYTGLLDLSGIDNGDRQRPQNDAWEILPTPPDPAGRNSRGKAPDDMDTSEDEC